MNFDWIKVIEKYAKSAIVSLLLFFTLCTIAVPFLWDRHDKLYNKALQIEKRQSALDIKEADLDRREQIIKEKSARTDNDCASQTQEALKKLNKKEDSLKNKEKEINRLKAKYSDAAKKYNAEQKVIALMDKFSSLGVDLHHEDWCDKGYTKRYYEGEAILIQIHSIVSSNNLNSSYDSFLQRHMSGIKTIGSSRKCEKDDEPQP